MRTKWYVFVFTPPWMDGCLSGLAASIGEARKKSRTETSVKAMGEITRRWPFDGESYPPFDLVVREPPLTGDNLGLKTWGSSYVLAQMLDAIAKHSLSHLLGPASGTPRPTVLELGSGTGLLGLAAAAIWQTRVLLSDLPEIMPNLAHNVQANQPMIAGLGGSVESGALTWGGDEDEIDPFLFVNKNAFKVCATWPRDRQTHTDVIRISRLVLTDQPPRSSSWLIRSTTTTTQASCLPR